MARPPKSASLSPTNISRVMGDVAAIREGLLNAAGQLDVDIDEYLFVLEHDTDLMSILDRCEELVSMKRDYAARAKARAAQLEKQAEAGRALFLAIMHRLEAKKLERPTYTASVVEGRLSLALDEAQIPFDYRTFVPDREAITRALKAGETVPGASMQRGAPFLRFSRGKETDETENPNGK